MKSSRQNSLVEDETENTKKKAEDDSGSEYRDQVMEIADSQIVVIDN